MRRVSLVVLLIAGCGAHRDAGPAWPKASTTASDGGESLAPRQPGSVAAVESGTDDKPSETPTPTAKPAATPAPAVGGGGTSASPPAVSPTGIEDPMTTEEIIIEIDGD